MNEFDTIEHYFAPLSATETGAFNLTDDAAVIEPPSGKSLVVTTDALVAGVHFFVDDKPEDIAAKLLRVSLSDLAAMGAEPAYYSLSIAVTPDQDNNWFRAFSSGLAADQKEFGVTLIGGDTVATPGPLTLSLTAMGYVEVGKAIKRSEALPGDDIWVSGTIGDGALGLLVARNNLKELSTDEQEYLLNYYHRPTPRSGLGPQLIDHVHAMIDISDGLIADLHHICAASGVGAKVQINDIPLSQATQSALSLDQAKLDLILSGGDDYELLFTADGSFEAFAQSIAEKNNVTLTKIGDINESQTIRIFSGNGSEYQLEQSGFTHF